MATIYCIALQDDGAGGGVHCYESEASRDAALGTTGARAEVPFTIDVQDGASDDEITDAADVFAWERGWLVKDETEG